MTFRIILLLAISFWLQQKATAEVIEVCPTCPVTTIRQGIELAQTGDEVRVFPGTYREGTILVNKSITLKGIDWPVIDGEDQYEILTILASGVTVEGFKLINAGKSTLRDMSAIRVDHQRHFSICDNIIENAQFGIYLAYGFDGIVENNRLESNAKEEISSGNGVHCWYAKRIFIAHNTIKRHRDGIYLEFTDDSRILDNWSENNLRYGLHFMFSNRDAYSYNTFMNNGAGVAVMFSKGIEMTHNLFEHNWGRSSYALLLKEIYDAKLENNQFLSNTIGILMEGATRIEYQHNLFKSNGWAIQMTGGCIDNHFESNAFISNALDMVVSSNVNNNTFDGNYWSEYTGYDLDRDGYGDVPHRPVKLFSYITSQTPETIVLLRSFFVDLLNFSEKVSPVLTPANVTDQKPLIQMPIL
ncbi:MAG: nitrous oxide reductase family maturation protein NosD [Saprospirales bacterium]|nr:nitrous oxide reductase family maturation protein NosD [Saprospirales bacterium]